MSRLLRRPVVVSLKQTCEFAPCQWEGRTKDNRPIYIRGRHGFLSVHIGPRGGTLHDALCSAYFAHMPLMQADFLSSDDVVVILGDFINFSKVKTIEPFDEWAGSLDG